MRIAFLIQRPQRRGVELFTTQLADALRERGHDARTAALYRAPEGSDLRLHPDDLRLDARPDAIGERVLGLQPSLVRRVRQFLARFAPDVLQVSGGRTVKYGVVSSLGSKNDMKLVWRNAGTASDWLRGRSRQFVYRRLLLPRIDGIVSVTTRNMEDFRQVYRPAVPMRRIPSGIAPGTVETRQERRAVRQGLDTPADAPVMVFVGNLSPEKRPDRFLRVANHVVAEIPDAVGWVVGDGPLRHETRDLAGRLGIESSVRFLGTRDDVGDLLGAADVLLLTSDSEGSPRVIMEAGLAGLPVAATRVGGVEDLTHHGTSGVVIDAGDEAALAAATVQLLRDEELRERYADAAKSWMRDHVTIDTVATQYENFYREIRGHARPVRD